MIYQVRVYKIIVVTHTHMRAHIHTQASIHTHRQAYTCTGRHALTGRHTHTHRQAYTFTDRHTYTHTEDEFCKYALNFNSFASFANVHITYSTMPATLVNLTQCSLVLIIWKCSSSAL